MADAYLVRVTEILVEVAQVLEKTEELSKYQKDYTDRLKAFRDQYLTPVGRLACDTQTAYVLALQFGLIPPEQIKLASDRLARLISSDKFKIGTGFAGTSSILSALSKTANLQVAYRMLQESQCPSWFYPITMGATTIWERWDSMLPDGSVNVRFSEPHGRSRGMLTSAV